MRMLEDGRFGVGETARMVCKLAHVNLSRSQVKFCLHYQVLHQGETSDIVVSERTVAFSLCRGGSL